MPTKDPVAATGNRLLDALPSDDVSTLLPHAMERALAPRDVVYEPDTPITSVQFPIEGMISLVTEMHDGSSAEAATIGQEGMVGIAAFLSGQPVASMRATCQVKASVLEIPADVLNAAAARMVALRDVLLAYTQAQMAQTAQIVACNALHTIPRRLARWLLQTQDSAGSDRFWLTQEFLAQMLGVRRASVTEAASTLSEKGVLEYRRGDITVLDRSGLERASCECYGTIKREYARLVPA
jgi:CRP-like cAMP-binding protein